MFLPPEKSTIARALHDQSFLSAARRIRPLSRGDVATIDTVFAGLSLRSRHQRFHTGVVRLSDRARAALADVDGCLRLALVAEVRSRRGWQPIGVARLHATAPGIGEMAIEVVDAWQDCGVGRDLLVALRDNAWSLGYSELHAMILPGNRAATTLLRSVFPQAVGHVEDGQVHHVIPLRSRQSAAA